MYFETHCHLDMLKKVNPTEAVEMANANNVNKIMTISVRPDDLEKIVDIANQFENVYGTQGIHPHEAQDFNQDVANRIIANTKNNSKIKAIGEIGLDYHYKYSPKKEQIEAFEKQLQIAFDLDMPIVIHTREADEDTTSIIKNCAKEIKGRAVFHSYTSGPELAQLALDLDCFIGFNGIITFKSAENVRDILKLCPVEQVFFETDSPFLSPIPHRGKENGPWNIPHIAQKIAEIKEIDQNKLNEIVFENSKRFFRLD